MQIKRIDNVSYGESGTNVLDIYLPVGEVSAVFVYFHGGGFVEGDKSMAEPLATYLAERNVATISINYRMYPDAQYPDFICDGASAVAFAYRYMTDELNAKRLYVGGSSAGGYMSMMLCFDEEFLGAQGIDNSQIAGYFHDAGQPTAHFNVLSHRGIDPHRVIVDESAPLYHITADRNYPPMHFVVSDNDIASRYEQIQLVMSTLRSFGYSDFGYTLMHGNHCEYCEKLDENGESILGKLIYEFISK